MVLVLLTHRTLKYTTDKFHLERKKPQSFKSGLQKSSLSVDPFFSILSVGKIPVTGWDDRIYI